jgi:hypothetical protein
MNLDVGLRPSELVWSSACLDVLLHPVVGIPCGGRNGHPGRVAIEKRGPLLLVV